MDIFNQIFCKLISWYKKSLTGGLLILKESGGVYGGAMATVQSHVEAVQNGGQELLTEDLAVLE